MENVRNNAMADYAVKYNGSLWYFYEDGIPSINVAPNLSQLRIREHIWQYLNLNDLIGEYTVIRIYNRDGTFQFNDAVTSK